MGMYKIVVFYRLHAQGWTETFYREAASAVQASQLNWNFEGRAIALRAVGTEYMGHRASAVSGPREVFLSLPPAPLIAGIVQHGDGAPDITAVSGLIRLHSQSGASRHLWLRGLPDANTIRESTGGASVPTAAYKQMIQQYIQAMTQNDLRIRQLSTNVANTASIVSMVNVNPPQSGYLELRTAGAPPAWSQGDTVVVRGPSTEDYPWLKGTFKIQSMTAQGFIIRVGADADSITASRSVILAARRHAYEYPEIDSGQFVRWGTHDTGRPIGVPRGRRAARRR